MPTTTIPMDRTTEDALFEQLQEKGFTCLDDAIDPAFLDECRQKVDSMLDQRGHRYFSVIQPQADEGSPFAAIAETPDFVDLLRNLARRGHSEAAVENFELYNVLRVIAGKEVAKRCFEFHYDATVVTALMPLYIPEGPLGTTGELAIFPNKRNFRFSSFFNIFEKIILQNPISFYFYRTKFFRDRWRIVNLKPGNLYFFWGYRTFHGNLPCLPGQKRATLIFHFGDPHAGDLLTKAVLKLRKYREARRLRAA